jgi:hypothetical protein
MVILTSLSLATGCSVLQPPVATEPGVLNEIPFRDRAQLQSDDDVRVTAAVPTAAEARALFGIDLVQREIQPVWVKVENHSAKTYYLMSTAVDPNYFSPLEAVYATTGFLDRTHRRGRAHFFRAMNFRNPIHPHTAVSGFVFTNLDEGEKVVQVDLIAEEETKFFTFFIEIPGMRVDYHIVDFEGLYPPHEIVELDAAGLRAALERLPCCTTDRDGGASGDPINLVIVGDFEDVAAAFARRGWLPAEETYATAVWKTIKSFFFGSRYRYSPVSPLYFFGRAQDFARQKPRRDIHERNHLRLWYSPFRYRGKSVFVGQVSRDIGVRFTAQVWPPVTHKIDPDIDEARHALAEDLLFSQNLARIGFVKGVGRATPSRPRTNLTGDPYFTDGLRLVLILEAGPISLEQIKSVGWEAPRTFHIGAGSSE